MKNEGEERSLLSEISQQSELAVSSKWQHVIEIPSSLFATFIFKIILLVRMNTIDF